IIDDINKLLSLDVGDTPRLMSIIETFEKRQIIYPSDRKYVEGLEVHFLRRHTKPVPKGLDHFS
ncbi:MAG: hypothetical protein WBF38_04960, partial [Nitrosotalea sp.]